MDWGLAKDLASGEHQRPEEPPETDNVTKTAAGAVLGTPGYMAPEQARGEVVDSRADVVRVGSDPGGYPDGSAGVRGRKHA
jgi:serine/threonine protein kinase